MTQVNEWDRCNDTLTRMKGAFDRLPRLIEVTSGLFSVAGFDHDKDQYARDIEAATENLNECYVRLERALGTREAFLAAQADSQRERSKQ